MVSPSEGEHGEPQRSGRSYYTAQGGVWSLRREKQPQRERTLSWGKTVCEEPEQKKQQEDLKETQLEGVGWVNSSGVGVVILSCERDHW